MKRPSKKPVNPAVGSSDKASQDDLATLRSLHDHLLFIPVGCTSRPPPGPHRNPCDVRCAADLPQRLYLGSLVTDTFSADDTGWRARYEDLPPGTVVELEYTTKNQTLHGRFTWNRLDSLSVFADGKNWKAFARQMALPVPDDWIQLLYGQLGLTSNVRYRFGPSATPAFSGFPDGPLMTLMLPVPVNRLCALPECLDRIDADASIKAPAAITAALASKTVTPQAATVEANNKARSAVGSEPAAAGCQVYLARITCFFRDVDRVVFCCQRTGLIGAFDPKADVTRHPHGAVWAALVCTGTGKVDGYSFLATRQESSWQVRYREIHPIDPASRMAAAYSVSRVEAQENLKAADEIFGQ